MKIVIATHNPHKLKELLAILPRKCTSGAIEYITLADLKKFQLPEETGATLEENAALKAMAAAKASGLPALADDTGLEVDALNGAPGVHTARYAGEQADHDDNNRKLLNALEGKLLPERTASFRTIACLSTPQGQTYLFEGSIKGHIGFGYRGTNGFGYDPVFIVDGCQKTMAELSESQKNKISHRARAFEKVADFLKNFVE